MRKKLIVMFLTLIFALTGCELISLEVAVEDPLSFLAFITEPSNDTTFTVTSRLFEAEKNVNVFFPEVKTPDQGHQEKVNSLIWSEMHRMLSIFPERENLTLDVNYEIKFSSNRLLSIVYTGIGFVQGSTRPVHLFYTLNINMETGEKIVLCNVISIDDRFVALLLSDNATHLNPHPELKQFVREIISGENFLYRFWDVGNSGFYFTNDSLGISIDGLGGAAGDHAELEIRYETLFLN